MAVGLPTETLELPWSAAAPLAAMRRQAQVLREESGESLSVTVRGRPAALARLRGRLGQ